MVNEEDKGFWQGVLEFLALLAIDGVRAFAIAWGWQWHAIPFAALFGMTLPVLSTFHVFTMLLLVPLFMEHTPPNDLWKAAGNSLIISIGGLILMGLLSFGW